MVTTTRSSTVTSHVDVYGFIWTCSNLSSSSSVFHLDMVAATCCFNADWQLSWMASSYTTCLNLSAHFPGVLWDFAICESVHVKWRGFTFVFFAIVSRLLLLLWLLLLCVICIHVDTLVSNVDMRAAISPVYIDGFITFRIRCRSSQNEFSDIFDIFHQDSLR